MERPVSHSTLPYQVVFHANPCEAPCYPILVPEVTLIHTVPASLSLPGPRTPACGQRSVALTALKGDKGREDAGDRGREREEGPEQRRRIIKGGRGRMDWEGQER